MAEKIIKDVVRLDRVNNPDPNNGDVWRDLDGAVKIHDQGSTNTVSWTAVTLDSDLAVDADADGDVDVFTGTLPAVGIYEFALFLEIENTSGANITDMDIEFGHTTGDTDVVYGGFYAHADGSGNKNHSEFHDTDPQLDASSFDCANGTTAYAAAHGTMKALGSDRRFALHLDAFGAGSVATIKASTSRLQYRKIA